jgi:hypothetical protein
MSHEKFDAQGDLGSKDVGPYVTPSSEEDVEEGGPKPLMRALESRHMQMIAIVSPSLSPTLPQGTTKKNRPPNAQNDLLGRCYRCWFIRWFRRSPR